MSNNANNVTGFEVYRHRSGRPVTHIERDWLSSAPACHSGSWAKQGATTKVWTKAVAGDALSALIKSFRYVDATGVEIESDFIPANTSGAKVVINDDPANCEYFARLNAAIGADAITLNFDILDGVDTTALSLQEINAATAATTTAQLRGIRYLKAQSTDLGSTDNALGDDITAAKARLVVRINENQSEPALGTVTALGA